MTDTYEYDAFGSIRAATGTSANEFTYTGEQVDTTGMQYLRARYYDPAVGRFLSQDRIRFLNRYMYASNSPINFVDPTGDCTVELHFKRLARVPVVRSIGPFLTIVMLTDIWHGYLVTRDPTDGSTLAYRGGPSGNGVLSLLPGIDGGDIVVESGAYKEGRFRDFQEEEPKAPIVLADDVFECTLRRTRMNETMDAINGGGFSYEALSQNSNTVIRELLESIGIPLKNPGLVGWDAGLEVP